MGASARGPAAAVVVVATAALPRGSAQAVLAPPFASAALWAAELPGLRACDNGIDDASGCPARPEHGGPGFLSAVFAWRYTLNNVRAALGAAGVAPHEGSAPAGALEGVVQVVEALDGLMERPLMDAFADVMQAARALLEALRPFLASQAAAPPSLGLPGVTRLAPRWQWPSDGGTPLGQASFLLRTGARMPAVGFGTWRLWAKEAYQPVRWALELGYRHIDTAEGYANEEHIGRALRDSGVPREEVFIATKLSSVPKGLADPRLTGEIFSMQLAQLGTSYVDLYMLHTPPQDPSQLRALWTMLESLYDQGLARALGVSNVDARELRELLSFARVPPAYVQNLFKIYKPGEQMFSEDDVLALAHQNHIAVMGYSVQTDWPHIMPPLQDPHVLHVASQVGRTPSQVLHRWALQRGVGVIPKSATRSRIEENARLLDFSLEESQMRLLDGLATLSESGARPPAKPAWQEDAFRLFAATAHEGLGASAWGNVAGAAASSGVAQSRDADLGSLGFAGLVEPELPAEVSVATRDRGFHFMAIRESLLGAAVRLGPGACRERCAREPLCAAWEVCAPYDPQSGCDGCYLIGASQAATVRIEGWHAEVMRPR